MQSVHPTVCLPGSQKIITVKYGAKYNHYNQNKEFVWIISMMVESIIDFYLNTKGETLTL